MKQRIEFEMDNHDGKYAGLYILTVHIDKNKLLVTAFLVSNKDKAEVPDKLIAVRQVENRSEEPLEVVKYIRLTEEQKNFVNANEIGAVQQIDELLKNATCIYKAPAVVMAIAPPKQHFALNLGNFALFNMKWWQHQFKGMSQGWLLGGLGLFAVLGSVIASRGNTAEVAVDMESVNQYPAPGGN
jgi:hypothetical protein